MSPSPNQSQATYRSSPGASVSLPSCESTQTRVCGFLCVTDDGACASPPLQLPDGRRSVLQEA